MFLHIEDEVVNRQRFLRKFSGNGESARDVAGVAVDFASGVEEKEVFSRGGVVVFYVVQGSSVFSRGDDGVVGLVFGAAFDAGFEEEGVQLGFVGCGGDGAHDGGVGCGGDGVGFADQGDFVGGFDYAGVFDGGFEEVEVFVGEGEEGYVVGDLGGDGVDGGLGGGGCGGEVGVYIRGSVDFIDVVSLLRFLHRHGQSAPDDLFRNDWWDEKSQLVALEVIGQV